MSLLQEIPVIALYVRWWPSNTRYTHRIFSLSGCGHTFCMACLIVHFKRNKREWIDPVITAYRLKRFRTRLHYALQDEAEVLIQQGFTTVFHPSRFADLIQSCPTCDESALVPPIRNYTLQKAISIGLPENTPFPDNDAETWKQFFECILPTTINGQANLAVQ